MDARANINEGEQAEALLAILLKFTREEGSMPQTAMGRGSSHHGRGAGVRGLLTMRQLTEKVTIQQQQIMVLLNEKIDNFVPRSENTVEYGAPTNSDYDDREICETKTDKFLKRKSLETSVVEE